MKSNNLPHVQSIPFFPSLTFNNFQWGCGLWDCLGIGAAVRSFSFRSGLKLLGNLGQAPGPPGTRPILSPWFMSLFGISLLTHCWGEQSALGTNTSQRSGTLRMQGQESRGSKRAAAKDRGGERSNRERREKGTGWQKGGQPRGELQGIGSTSHGLSCLKTSDQKHCWANYHPDDWKLLWGAGRSWFPVFQYLFSA